MSLPHRSRTIFSEKRALLAEFIEGEGLEIIGSEASFYLWFKAPGKLDGEDYAMRLLNHGIVVAPGAFFGLGDSARSFVRVALVPSVPQCKEALVAWRAAHQELRESLESWNS